MPARLHDPSSPWEPDETFNRTDADVIAILLAQNAIRYYDRVDDPFFFANYSDETYCEGTDCVPLYSGNYIFNLMGCLEQFQFCNPNTNLCTDLTGFVDASFQLNGLGLSAAQNASAARVALAAGLSYFFYGIPNYGSTGKFSSLSSHVSVS